jgi:23S rRNA (adenine2503-C2)-methyltransferase
MDSDKVGPEVSVVHQESSVSEPGTRRFVIQLNSDRSTVECVVFPNASNTVCVSTQVGCVASCHFCESGKGPFGRNLTVGEIIGQLEAAQSSIEVEGQKINYLIFQGVGEPLLNYRNVTSTMRSLILNQRWQGLRFCISTVGIIERIYELATEGIPVNLYVSLHGTTDEQRRTLIPYAKSQRLKDILRSMKFYTEHGQKDLPVGIQYLLFAGVNDSIDDARRLADFSSDGPYQVILKKACPIDGQIYFPATDERFKQFADILGSAGVTHYISESRARDINGGCGQLRKSFGLRRARPRVS